MMYTKQDCGLTELGPESEQFTMVHVHTEHTGPADRLPWKEFGGFYRIRRGAALPRPR